MKSPEAFRTISEAAAELGVPQHVLRFWETKFSFIRPMKRAGGRRFYRRQDIELLRGVRILLHTEGYTIKGVQRLHKEHGVRRLMEAGVEGGEIAAPRPNDASPSIFVEAAGADEGGDERGDEGDIESFVEAPGEGDQEMDDLFETVEGRDNLTLSDSFATSPAEPDGAQAPSPQNHTSVPARPILSPAARARLIDVLGDLDATKARLDQLLIGDDS